LLSRLDSKSEGPVVIVMQRLHEDDLAGRLLEKGDWHQLKITAVAEQDEHIPVGPRRRYKRNVGTVIDPRRESLEDLARLKQSMGELFFSAQYQQEPIPLAGNLIKAEWFREYEVTPTYTYNDVLAISIDTAMKGRPTCRLFGCYGLAWPRRPLLSARSLARTGRLSRPQACRIPASREAPEGHAANRRQELRDKPNSGSKSE